ncbi:hypothetical protein HMPREF0972_01748 [Actinomyces sp. oral taxon 848 str. F0332]|nr:hypothetical protein HMPREF0972_01748 [Actinomyces sp. oral taxon 848 str. F0332]
MNIVGRLQGCQLAKESVDRFALLIRRFGLFPHLFRKTFE